MNELMMSLEKQVGHDCQSRSVLIVDDDDLIADFYQIVMEIGQLDFKLVKTQSDAIRCFLDCHSRGEAFSTLILDWCLPGKLDPPFSMIKAMKATNPNLFVLVVTGAPHLVPRGPLFEELVDLLLPKPVKPSVLLEALNSSQRI